MNRTLTLFAAALTLTLSGCTPKNIKPTPPPVEQTQDPTCMVTLTSPDLDCRGYVYVNGLELTPGYNAEATFDLLYYYAGNEFLIFDHGCYQVEIQECPLEQVDAFEGGIVFHNPHMTPTPLPPGDENSIQAACQQVDDSYWMGKSFYPDDLPVLHTVEEIRETREQCEQNNGVPCSVVYFVEFLIDYRLVDEHPEQAVMDCYANDVDVLTIVSREHGSDQGMRSRTEMNQIKIVSLSTYPVQLRK